MTIPDELTSLTLSGLRHRCSQESERFFKRQSHDPRFCYELFRRAVLRRDSHAWELLYLQYQPLITGWVERHSMFPATGEEAQFFANWAFEKMWAVLTPEKLAKFPDLKSILRYLQMCVHSVIVDYLRSHEQAALLEDLSGDEEEPALENQADGLNLEKQVFDQAQGDALWRWLNGRLKSEKERAVVYGCFVLALKPAEVYAEYPRVFGSVREVYLTKENLLERLRRDPELAGWLD